MEENGEGSRKDTIEKIGGGGDNSYYKMIKEIVDPPIPCQKKFSTALNY